MSDAVTPTRPPIPAAATEDLTSARATLATNLTISSDGQINSVIMINVGAEIVSRWRGAGFSEAFARDQARRFADRLAHIERRDRAYETELAAVAEAIR